MNNYNISFIKSPSNIEINLNSSAPLPVFNELSKPFENIKGY